MPVGRSKIVLDVLRLYADYMRLSPHVHGLKDIARAEFRQHKHLKAKDNLIYIDYLIRRGKSQLATLKGQGVTSIHFSSPKSRT
jgi:hypothetical protein